MNLDALLDEQSFISMSNFPHKEELLHLNQLELNDLIRRNSEAEETGDVLRSYLAGPDIDSYHSKETTLLQPGPISCDVVQSDTRDTILR